ncbi:hypothetical protein B0H13DRAFT_2505348 [Mycena leptocephala]|nr:hypothetical protein B0H13DRAFT_2505348 [Mycena leptocephala]
MLPPGRRSSDGEIKRAANTIKDSKHVLPSVGLRISGVNCYCAGCDGNDAKQLAVAIEILRECRAQGHKTSRDRERWKPHQNRRRGGLPLALRRHHRAPKRPCNDLSPEDPTLDGLLAIMGNKPSWRPLEGSRGLIPGSSAFLPGEAEHTSPRSYIPFQNRRCAAGPTLGNFPDAALDVPPQPSLPLLDKRNFQKAAYTFLRLGSSRDWNGKGRHRHLRVLCARAILPCPALKMQTLENSTFGEYVELAPYVRELVGAHLSRTFKTVLELLNRYSWRRALDIYLAPQVTELMNMILNWVEEQVFALIQSDSIHERVDNQNNILYSTCSPGSTPHTRSSTCRGWEPYRCRAVFGRALHNMCYVEILAAVHKPAVAAEGRWRGFDLPALVLGDRHWIRLPGTRAARCALMATMANVADISLEACEFWLTFTEDADLAMHLRPLLGRAAPILLDCTVYTCYKAADINLPHYGGLERRSFVFSPRAPSRDAQARAGTPSLTHLKAIPRPPTRRLTGTSDLPALIPAPAYASPRKRVQEADAFATLEEDAGLELAPYFELVLQNLVVAFDNNIIHQSLLKYQAFQQNPNMEEPDRSFLVVALGLLSGLTQYGLGVEPKPLIKASNPNLLQACSPCASSTPRRPCDSLVQVLGAPADRAADSDSVAPQTRSRHKNAAVSVGRVGLTHPDIVPPHLPEFMWP